MHSAYGLKGPRFKSYSVGIFPLTGFSPQGLKILGEKLHDGVSVPWCLSYGPCLLPSYTEGLYHVNLLCSMDYLAIIALCAPGGHHPSRQASRK